MSKKYYVLYSLKEFIVPKVFKTKATLNKYLQKNANYVFKQFYDQDEAYQFSNQIEKQMEHKFRIKVQQHLQTTFIDQRVQSSLKVEKQKEQKKGKKSVEEKETNRIIDEILFGDTTSKQIKNKKSKKQQQKVNVEGAQSQKKSLKKEQQSKKEEKELEQFEKQYNKIATNNNQQIQNKQANLSNKVQDSQKQQPAIGEAAKVLSQSKSLNPQILNIKQQHKDKGIEEKEQIVKIQQVKAKEQTIQQVIKPKERQQATVSVKRTEQLQTQSQISIEEIKQLQKATVTQPNINIIQTQQVQKVHPKIQQDNSINQDIETIQSIEQPVALPTQLQQQFVLLNQTLSSLPQIPLQMYQFQKNQNQDNFLQNHPLHKNSINLPYFNIQSKLLHHFTKYTQLLLQQNNQTTSLSPSTLKIYLSQKQNPGLAMVKYVLITSRGQFKKMQMLGVKSTSQSQMLSLWKGLQMAKFYGQTNLEIETSFSSKPIERYKKSIDKSVREHAQNYLNMEKKFTRIEYL